MQGTQMFSGAQLSTERSVISVQHVITGEDGEITDIVDYGLGQINLCAEGENGVIHFHDGLTIEGHIVFVRTVTNTPLPKPVPGTKYQAPTPVVKAGALGDWSPRCNLSDQPTPDELAPNVANVFQVTPEMDAQLSALAGIPPMDAKKFTAEHLGTFERVYTASEADREFGHNRPCDCDITQTCEKCDPFRLPHHTIYEKGPVVAQAAQFFPVSIYEDARHEPETDPRTEALNEHLEAREAELEAGAAEGPRVQEEPASEPQTGSERGSFADHLWNARHGFETLGTGGPAADPGELDADGFNTNAQPNPTEEFTEFLKKVLDDGPEITQDGYDAEHSVPKGFAAQVIETVRNRGSDYGTPSENHELTAILWSEWLARRLRKQINLSAEDVIMLNVLQKASRLAYTTKNDSWLDIAGYTENVAMLSDEQRNHQRGR